MPKVIIWRDGAIETEFDPGHRDWRVGRSETNDITLLDPRKSVSRFHAEVREENGRWVFIDLKSQNGSWKDGQRVNRLVLEHGHRVQFGDYTLAFEEVKVAAPPAPDSQVPTADVPLSPDATLLMPGKAQPPVAGRPAAAPAPVVRPAVRASPPRNGVNPVILVLFILAMLGAVAAVAWKVLSAGEQDPPAVHNAEPAEPAAPSPEPAPAGKPEGAPTASADSSPAPATPGVAPATEVPVAPAAVAVSPPPTAPPARSGPIAKSPPPAGPGTGPAAAPPRSKRVTSPPPKDAPGIVLRYDEGRRALTAGRFGDAERAFQSVLVLQPGFRDTAALLAQAREGQAMAARDKALTEARGFEASGDWSSAIAAYERAGASDQAARARTKMTAAGDDAYRKARQFDARNRPTDAITWYQRAVQWLPDIDSRKAIAQERLAALKGGGA